MANIYPTLKPTATKSKEAQKRYLLNPFGEGLRQITSAQLPNGLLVLFTSNKDEETEFYAPISYCS